MTPEVKHRAGQTRRGPRMPENAHRTDRVERAADHRDQQEAHADEHHEQVREEHRYEEVPVLPRRTMVEDDRHGALDHGEGRRAEEDERQQPDHPDDLTVGQEVLDLCGHRRGLAGNHELEIRGDRVEQPMLVDDVRQAHQQHHEQRHDRQQRVVGDRAGQEEPLAPPETGHDAPAEVEERSQDQRRAPSRYKTTRMSRTVPTTPRPPRDPHREYP